MPIRAVEPCTVLLLCVTTLSCAAVRPLAQPPQPETAISVQLDTGGVDFAPWIKRFVAQIKSNWIIQYRDTSVRAHVVVTFRVQTDGHITDLMLKAASGTASLDTAAYRAVAACDPTARLPSGYGHDYATFSMTFCYNESPPKQETTLVGGD